MAETPSPDKHAFLLRLPPALFERVRALAASEMRSVNAQIEFLLAEAVRRRSSGPPARRAEEDSGEEEPGGRPRGGGPPATPGGRGSSRG